MSFQMQKKQRQHIKSLQNVIGAPVTIRQTIDRIARQRFYDGQQAYTQVVRPVEMMWDITFSRMVSTFRMLCFMVMCDYGERTRYALSGAVGELLGSLENLSKARKILDSTYQDHGVQVDEAKVQPAIADAMRLAELVEQAYDSETPDDLMVVRALVCSKFPEFIPMLTMQPIAPEKAEANP
jgi:hypothetical protein